MEDASSTIANRMLILASSSPRRAELLRNAGFKFRVQASDVPEQRQDSEPPLEYCMRLAQDKARTVFAENSQDVVLGADTIVVLDEHVLEKPSDEADVRRMLKMLSGRKHTVSTGVCLIGPKFEDVQSETTEVLVDTLSEEDIASYIASGEGIGKAGAYGIQGMFGRWIPRIDGCYFNIVGLPVPLVWRMMKKFGVG
jgi:septum formation protein